MAENSNLLKELKNEAKVKEMIDKDQIFELNKAMIEGKDLNKAAKAIFGTKNEKETKNDGKNEMKVKKPNENFFEARNYHWSYQNIL